MANVATMCASGGATLTLDAGFYKLMDAGTDGQLIISAGGKISDGIRTSILCGFGYSAVAVPVP
jgi:hypothetical protein